MVSITQISTATDLSALNGTKATSNTTTTSTGTNAASDNASKLKNQFLNILLTQMQNQNPLDPMDTKEFTAQLTQFSSLEQQIDTNTKLDGLVTSLKQSAVANSFGYIDQYVDVASNQSALQDGKANWTYSLPSGAKSITVKVTDAKGNTLYTKEVTPESGRGEIAAGTYNLALTKDDLLTTTADGSPLNLTLSAIDTNGTAIKTKAQTTVHVDSVQADSTGTYIMAGNVLYNMTDIKKIVKAPTTPATL